MDCLTILQVFALERICWNCRFFNFRCHCDIFFPIIILDSARFGPLIMQQNHGLEDPHDHLKIVHASNNSYKSKWNLVTQKIWLNIHDIVSLARFRSIFNINRAWCDDCSIVEGTNIISLPRFKKRFYIPVCQMWGFVIMFRANDAFGQGQIFFSFVLKRCSNSFID